MLSYHSIFWPLVSYLMPSLLYLQHCAAIPVQMIWNALVANPAWGGRKVSGLGTIHPLKKGCSDIVREPYRVSHHLKTCHSMLLELFFSFPLQWIWLSHCFVGSGGTIFGD